MCSRYLGIDVKSLTFQISLIDRVHKIYNDTLWQDRQESDGFKGMGFVIKKIVVHSEPTRVRGGESHYNMIKDKWDVRNLLEVSTPLMFSFNMGKEGGMNLNASKSDIVQHIHYNSC